MSMIVSVGRSLDYRRALGEQPGQLLQTIRQLVREVRSEDPRLHECELYDIGFKRQGDQVWLRFYFKQAASKAQI
ncbi:MAG: hypothetical protein ACOX2K_01670 [Bacillota bacterium]|jgi:hypothetical protein